MNIQKVLTDNGSQFTDRFTSQGKCATGNHAFDLACTSLNIEHRHSPSRHPQTNSMVERFNGRISDLVKQTRFTSAAELETTLEQYLKIYNHHIPQRALHHQTPIQALKKWQAEKLDLFDKGVYEQAGLDSLGAESQSNAFTACIANPSRSCRQQNQNQCDVKNDPAAFDRYRY